MVAKKASFSQPKDVGDCHLLIPAQISFLWQSPIHCAVLPQLLILCIHSHAFLHCYLVSPKTIFVKPSKAVNDNRDGKSDGENACESTEPTNKLAKESLL
eukprot:GFUD01120639.1.p1 GENE.GFUD01120639.1~~GFUD01120639.1.p1  ORF type:complete len:110 (+),score=4.88 GFUD01120639.1:33-332(+)